MSVHYTEAEVISRVDGLTVTRLRSFTAARCVLPVEREGRPTFAEPDVARLRLLCELAADFDLDEEGAAMVLSLVDQIHGLRQELRVLADAVAGEPDEIRRRIALRAAGARGASSPP
jgi:chaperone modulatory protein CbpM